MHETEKRNTSSLPSACSYDLLKSYHDLLTTNDICKLLHISKPTVYSLVENHELVAICIGRINLYPKASVRALLERRMR